jgi:biopolymer transport protein ExbD
MGKVVKGDEHGGGVGHGDRPWVYFMVDAFLLMNNFFIMTFKFKQEEPILVQRMPPGSTAPVRSPKLSNKQNLVIHVNRRGEEIGYEYMSRRVTLEELSNTLAGVAASGKELSVRVSYTDEAHWQDIISVYNACQKLKISECGLIPSRTVAAGKM